MKDILKRLFHITRAHSPKPPRFFPKKQQKIRFASDREGASNRSESSYSDASEGSERSSHRSRKNSNKGTGGIDYPGVPAQVVEDLAVFDLTPPSSLKEIREVRNGEIKKYHSDKFLHDPEKLDTSKKIMQIYNTAFDRLEEYYKNG